MAANATPPNLIPPPPAGAGIFTVVSGDDSTTVRAPYLSEAERRRWLAYLPEKELVAADLLSSLFATPQTRDGTETTGNMPHAVNSRLENGDHARTNGAQKIAGLQTGFAAAESVFAISDLGFSPTDIAEIGARIARGEKKTEVVRTMRGYNTRRHQEFAAYYDMLYRELGERRLV
jgi:hypothetical protein